MKNKLISVSGGVLVLVGVVLIGLYLIGGPSPGKLDMKIQTKPTVMTVAYKAYGNPEAADGRYWLAKMVLNNSGESALRDLEVSYRIPGLIEWTTPDTAAELLPGQTAVLPIYPRFPAKVTRTRSRTPHTLEIKVDYLSDGKPVSVVEKRDFELRGVTEIEFTDIEASEIASWYDMWVNADILAAYMTDEDPVLKAYFGKISETMGGTPYVETNQDLTKLLSTIYDFQVQTGMVYMGAKGVPEKLGDTQTLVQSVKLPREVIQGNSATCIELTVLMSALLNQCGVKSQMVLIPGHAFPIIEMPNGQMIAFETTGIGGSNLGGIKSFEQALKEGNETWAKCQKGENPFMIVDYQARQAEGIRPPELDPVDQSSIEKMLSDRIARGKTQQNQTIEEPRTPSDDDLGRGQNNLTNLSSFRSSNGMLSLGYPTDWVHNAAFVQQMHQSGFPWYQFNATDTGTGWNVEVYEFSSTNHRACLETLQQFGSNYGVQMNISQGRPVNIAGTQWTYYPVGILNQAGVLMTSHIYMYSQQGATYAVALGGPDRSYDQAKSDFPAILNSIQIAE